MQYILKIEDIEIPVHIKNYKTAKSIKIYFKGDCLTVTKSPYIPKKEVDKLIKVNEKKIYEKYKEIVEKKRLKRGRWETGQIILYNGEEDIIDLCYHEKDNIKFYV